MSRSVIFVLKGYPRLSETFIAQEIYELEKRGLQILIVALRHPTDDARHPVHDQIGADVLYLPEFPLREVGRIVRAWKAVRNKPGYRAAMRLWFQDLKRGISKDKLKSFPQALVLAHEAPETVTQIHAHYLHTPSTVTRYAAMIRDLPWTCSAHARDIWTISDQEKSEKLASMDWLVTCTAHGWQHLKSLASNPSRVELVYHGLDFSWFPAARTDHSKADGSNPSDPVTILSVGRMVEKKGYEDLLAALAALPTKLNWRFVHIGFGPLEQPLKLLAKELQLDNRVEWRGALAQEAVIDAYRSADLFVLANKVAGDGDMDGLPNVMMEAQSQGLACLSTNLSAIPELIDDTVTGVLVEPGDVKAMTQTLETLIRSPDLRERLGKAGAARVRERFSHEGGIDQLAEKFGITADPKRLTA